MPKPTFADIAEHAGVGTATVERVLNGRGGVRPATAEKVIAAARTLDYPRRLPEVHRGLLRIEVILVRPETTFFRRLSRAFERISATLDPSVRVHRTFMEEADPRGHCGAHRLDRDAAGRADPCRARPSRDPRGRRHRSCLRPAGRPRRHPRGRRRRRSGQHRQLCRRAHGRALPVADAGPGAARSWRSATRSTRCTANGCAASPTFSRRSRARGSPSVGSASGGTRRGAAATCLFEALEMWPDLVGLYNVGAANAALADVLRRHPRGQAGLLRRSRTDREQCGRASGGRDVRRPRPGARGAGPTGDRPDAQDRSACSTWSSTPTPIRFITLTAENL